MESNRSKIIEQYRTKIKNANKELTKKEIFKDLLNRLYIGDKQIEKIIDSISSGAETTIVNIPRKDKLHRGSADTLFNKIIIEFENDLKRSLNHAKEQLSGYLLGQLRSGEGYNYTLIASDFITWKVFAPDISCIGKLHELQEHELLLSEIKSASFTLNDHNADDFYYWIDRFLFKEEKQKATLKRVEEAFGYQSNVFIDCYSELAKGYQDAKKYGEVQVSYSQWNRFLSIAYGSFDPEHDHFLIHTYLSVFSKMLAYSIISHNEFISEEDMKSILDGSIFLKFNLQNFVENDFFHWVCNENNFRNLKKVFRLLAQEISLFDFSEVDEDVLKGVYQELIDHDTRHALGEYYTPDWLCERIVNEFDMKKDDNILDPACGSGSFLRAIIHRFKTLHPELTSIEINEHVYGIDIHPLSIQISKTTVLIAYGKEIVSSKKPIHLNIILANTLLSPEGVQTLFGGEFALNIDEERYLLNTQVFEDAKLFDEALEICDNLAEQTSHKKTESLTTFRNILMGNSKNGGYNGQVIDSFYQIYIGLKKVKERGRDSIWKFIIQNLYKPYFLSERFQYIVGNPPWLTYSSIKREDYQEILYALAEKYGVKPERKANFPHLEIAAIFLAYCSSYFLKSNGQLAFVLPRSFISADHHDNIRKGKAKGFKINQIWDLEKVHPLFRIPSTVFFVEKANGARNIKEIPGRIFKGQLKEHNCNLQTAETNLEEEAVTWHYIKQGGSSAFSTRNDKQKTRLNPYKRKFKQGATIVPRGFYFIEIDQELPPDLSDRIIHIKTSPAIKRQSKKPWNIIDFKGRMESRFFFRTALSKSILPFALYNPDLITLPIIISENSKTGKFIKLYSHEELMREGYLQASSWFRKAENIWKTSRTEKSKNMSISERLNFQNGIITQNLNSKYLVLYSASAKDANATILIRGLNELEFIVESKAYWYATNNIGEANYLTAILNSSVPNLLMKDFQSRGLFGARDVHKKILDVYFPSFNNKNRDHIKLANLSEIAHQKASQYLENNTPFRDLTPYHLGRLRLAIKKHLENELQEIDKIVSNPLFDIF